MAEPAENPAEEPTVNPAGAEDAHPAEAALDSVEQAASAVEAAAAEVADAGGEETVDLPDFSPETAPAGEAASGIGLLDDVSLRVKIELGRTKMYVEDVLHLGTDSIIELDKAAGDPVDIYVNDRHIARGEVLVLNENFCVRVSEIISTAQHEE